MFKTIHVNMLQLQNLRETNKKTVFLTMLEITQLIARDSNAETFYAKCYKLFYSTPH